MSRDRHAAMLAMLLTACAPDDVLGGASATTSGEGDSADVSSAIGGLGGSGNGRPSDSTSVGSEDAAYEEDEGADGCTFTCPPDPPAPSPDSSFECLIGVQGCPPGEKCMPWDATGGRVWNATRCSGIVEDPGGPGDDCVAHGDGFSGIDDCTLGSVCFNVDPRTNEGVCQQLCGAVDGAPWCPEGTLCGDYGTADVCVTPCDPLGTQCPKEMGCYPAGAVDPNGNGALPPFFTCERLLYDTKAVECFDVQSMCQPGSLCVPAERLAECGGTYCCTPLCAQNVPDPCPTATACAPYLDPAPNDSVANVGVCLPD